MPETLLLDLKKITFPPDARPHTPEKLAMLAQDMKQQGQLQEIVVTPVKTGYEVVAGVGRTLAARKLGWTQIRALVRAGLSPFEKARITFAENENREDADPFYQAMQLGKMIAAKEYSQDKLAAELGISGALVNDYIAIDHLSPKVKEKLRRLNVNQLTQITRLKHADSQIELGEKCEKNDLSVRQLKALVERSLRKVKHKRAGSSEDPLADFWEDLAQKSKLPQGSWAANFSGRGTWRLTIQLPANGEFENDMARVLQALAGATSEVSIKEEYVKAQQRKAMQLGSISKNALNASRGTVPNEQFRQAFENIRLPKTALERAELEAQTMYGPAHVYNWIYGSDNLYTRQYQDKTWADLGIDDPVKEVKKMVAELEKLNSL